MPIPDYQSAMLPLLRLAGDGIEHKFRDVVEALAEHFNATPEERSEMLPSGTAPLFDNRIGWARTYLKQAGLLIAPKRGVFRISEHGQRLLASNPSRIDVELLDQFEEFRAFKARRKESQASPSTFLAGESTLQPRITDAQESVQDNPAQTPEDTLATAYRRLRNDLEIDLLEQIKASTPAFFERLVVDLLVTMGYGGNRRDAGRAVGASGDGGIDGIIKEDRLGLDVIYIQAKRWEGTVGRPEIQKFAGALQGHRANKGVFLTTSSYSKEATEYASMINTKIVLIGGRELAQLMVDHNVGVSSAGVYELKRIDSDYFEGE